jgi:hypothetical protein
MRYKCATTLSERDRQGDHLLLCNNRMAPTIIQHHPRFIDATGQCDSGGSSRALPLVEAFDDTDER